MKRKDTWPEDLDIYFNMVADTPFEMGVHDCGLFACGAIDTMCGTALRDELKASRYTSTVQEASALDLLATKYGMKEVSITRAQRGDIVYHVSKQGPTVLVCCGTVSLGPGTTGIQSVPTLECVKAWRV